MKSLITLFSLSLLIFLATSCNKKEPDPDCAICTHEIGPSEMSADIPASAEELFIMKATSVGSQSPFALGTEATFVLADDVLGVSIDGEPCHNIQGAVDSSGTFSLFDFKFIDNCKNNRIYYIEIVDGFVAEVVLFTLDSKTVIAVFS